MALLSDPILAVTPAQLRVQYLWTLSQSLAETCPTMATHYMCVKSCDFVISLSFCHFVILSLCLSFFLFLFLFFFFFFFLFLFVYLSLSMSSSFCESLCPRLTVHLSSTGSAQMERVASAVEGAGDPLPIAARYQVCRRCGCPVPPKAQRTLVKKRLKLKRASTSGDVTKTCRQAHVVKCSQCGHTSHYPVDRRRGHARGGGAGGSETKADAAAGQASAAAPSAATDGTLPSSASLPPPAATAASTPTTPTPTAGPRLTSQGGKGTRGRGGKGGRGGGRGGGGAGRGGNKPSRRKKQKGAFSALLQAEASTDAMSDLKFVM